MRWKDLPFKSYRCVYYQTNPKKNKKKKKKKKKKKATVFVLKVRKHIYIKEMRRNACPVFDAGIKFLFQDGALKIKTNKIFFCWGLRTRLGLVVVPATIAPPGVNK